MTLDDLAVDSANRYFQSRRARRSERFIAILGSALILTIIALTTYDLISMAS